ncbi:MAG: ParB/RepB/Spo0J family partition protein [Oscillospiraceae bacterium]|nr:ParB/RepB/Spo0J family partition protein [Oscillospiraceae bacterium]
MRLTSSQVDEIYDKITFEVGDDLLPKYTLDKFTRNHSEEVILVGDNYLENQEKLRRFYEKTLKKRAIDFSNGVDLFKDFRYIDIDKIEMDRSGWNYFDKPDDMELLNLISSLQTIGLVNPILVKTLDDENYTIISGNSRFSAFANIFKNTQDIRFSKIPCFIVDNTIDEYYQRSIIIDTNINYRKVSQEVFIRAIFEKYEMLKRIKAYRGTEINIAETIAKDLRISESTVFNYLTLRKLYPDAMRLVYDKKLKLRSARKLSRLSLENQAYILENVKLEDLNVKHKIRILTKNPSANLSEIKKRAELIANFTPYKTQVTVEVTREALERFFNNIIDFKKFIYANFSKTMNEKMVKDMVKVKVNKEHMKFYVKEKIIDGSLLEDVCGKELNEILAV